MWRKTVKYILEIFQPSFPWLLFLIMIIVFRQLFSWAKNKKTGALVFCILTQMFMPDPYVEKTVQIVQEKKKESKKTGGSEWRFGYKRKDIELTECNIISCLTCLYS